MLLAGIGLISWIVCDIWSSGPQDWTRLTSFGFCFGLITVGLMWLRGGNAQTAKSPISVKPPAVINLARTELSSSDSFPINDLGQLSAAGWCLTLITVATVVGILVPGAILFSNDTVPGKSTNWAMIFVLASAFLVGLVVYQAGKRLLWLCGFNVRCHDQSSNPLTPPIQGLAKPFDAECVAEDQMRRENRVRE
jgi:hypothetical protein